MMHHDIRYTIIDWHYRRYSNTSMEWTIPKNLFNYKLYICQCYIHSVFYSWMVLIAYAKNVIGKVEWLKHLACDRFNQCIAIMITYAYWDECSWSPVLVCSYMWFALKYNLRKNYPITPPLGFDILLKLA